MRATLLMRATLPGVAIALLALDVDLAAELGAVGRAPWQVLAGVIEADPRDWTCVSSTLLVPFGVAYHVAVLEPGA